MKLRKLARQLAAAAVAGAMALSLCMPALAETWNISNPPDGFKEVYFVNVEGTSSGRTVVLYGVDTSGDTHSSSCTETTETVLSDSCAVNIDLDGRDAPVSVTLKELYTTVEKEQNAVSQACVETGGDVSVELRGDNAIHVTKAGVGIRSGQNAALTIGGSGTLDVEAPNRGIEVDSGSFTLKGGTLNVTNGGINMSNGTVQVAGGELNVTNDGISTYNGTLQVTSGTLNVTNGDIKVDGGSFTMNGGSVHVSMVQEDANDTPAALYASNGISISGGSVVNVEGGAIQAGSSIDISGGEVNADVLGCSGILTISGGKVTTKGFEVEEGIVLSGNARVTCDSDLSDVPINLDGLTTEGYLRYKPEGTPDTAGEESYVVIRGTKVPPAPADTDTGTAPAGDAGGALAAVALGGAALWGGYEAATRVILHNLLPEGAAIPKTQAQLALLLWNTAGQPEPANEPAFANVDAATAKAAQWCTEQGYLNGTFKPDKRVAKYNVIRTWNKAFPKH